MGDFVPFKRKCVLCGGEFLVELERMASGEKVKKFCGEKCQHMWWAGQTNDPELPKVKPEACTPTQTAVELRQEREDYIKLKIADPYRYGDFPKHWERAEEHWAKASEMLVSGGNQTGKTNYAARKVVETMLDGRKNILCCHTSEATSITIQQSAIFKWLPHELRQTKKGKVHYLSFSRKNGFTGKGFILPNESRCDFLNYTQDIAQIEGREVDMVWTDELVPQPWIDTLRYRLITRRGKLLITQTPLEGIASVYGEFVAGGQVLEWGDAELLAGKQAFPNWPVGKAPRAMLCANPTRRVVWFFSGDNKYSSYDDIKEKLIGAPTGQILVRAYGWAVDSGGKAFNRFRPDVHCIDKEKIPKEGTLYMVVDPAGARNWFTLWVLVCANGHMFVVREFPDLPSYGEWAVGGDKPDGKVGPAQRSGACKGIPEYRQIVREIEAELGYGEPLMRLIDPKAGGTPAVSDQGGTTLIDLLATPSDSDEGMGFAPAPGVPADQRIAAVNSMLSFDSTKDISPINQPKLYISKECYNLIWCMAEYTGNDGLKGASKDPIDCIGMIVTSGCEYVENNSFTTIGGGSY